MEGVKYLRHPILSILLKSYWNRCLHSSSPFPRIPFNSFKVLLEPLVFDVYELNGTPFNSFKVLLELFGKGGRGPEKKNFQFF